MKLFHGSSRKITGALQPVLRRDSPDHIHNRACVFATERIDLAALFMFDFQVLASIGFEQDIAYVCIWGTAEEFAPKDQGGFVYVLPPDTFEKVGKGYEYQSFTAVMPDEIKAYDSAIGGMIECGAQVYFINDDPTFDIVQADKDHRAPLLKTLLSENQKQNINVKNFA